MSVIRYSTKGGILEKKKQGKEQGRRKKKRTNENHNSEKWTKKNRAMRYRGNFDLGDYS